jgi:hypothetical protein
VVKLRSSLNDDVELELSRPRRTFPKLTQPTRLLKYFEEEAKHDQRFPEEQTV